ncbi:MAG: DUF721 domain-containing protein [Lentisphaerae bacterium]|nr:DUF721 domain-containing protein [Lentisphaerota bacterium]
MRSSNRRRSRKSGAWAVQRERFQLTDPVPPAGVADATPMSEILGRVMRKAGLTEQHWAAVLEEAWSEVVGGELACHTRAGALDEKALTVYVDSPIWLNELRRVGQQLMLNNVQKRFGPSRITSIRLELDPG